MLKCECGRLFEDRIALRQHGIATHSRDCTHCDRKFATSSALDQHTLTLHSEQCDSCKECFRNRKQLRRHQESTTHCFCRPCNLYFESTNALRKHELAPGHVGQFHCCDCDRDFVNSSALEQHLQNKIHTFTKRPKEGYVCEQCDRGFSSQNALNQHRGSLVHRPLSDLECIDPKCRKRFKSPSSLLHHLESGTCRSGMNRDKLNGLICAYDTDQIISIRGQPQIAAFDDTTSTCSDSSTESEIIYTPCSTVSGRSLSPVGTAVRSYSSKPKKFLGIGCSECTRTFKSLEALDQHRQSAAHSSALFNCPAPLLIGNSAAPIPLSSLRSFNTVSGLVQHLESGACAGGLTMLREAAGYIENCLQNMGLKRSILIKDVK
ncbi:zinc finger protein [Penicillium vulpinum]|uniref:C2H2-type domain-containing protein n=1 Tax=Penicillium vulpinum TaxID=29845 RepID=A0A1V6S455_9EURO|nr:zinc finger protein [Penicillium vulpinum]KAJ5963477.1 zinc finger protein [Penicillium vulpinum]OQE08510.1 hypothetical protein PENVUL_c009G08327 [Penicillium vulpinum]